MKNYFVVYARLGGINFKFLELLAHLCEVEPHIKAAAFENLPELSVGEDQVVIFVQDVTLHPHTPSERFL